MASAHLEALSSRHRLIDGEIASEMRRPVPDSARLRRLKREKLRLKDEIARNS
ncbi:YdcH family protein [Thermaurantiacus sp.]